MVNSSEFRPKTELSSEEFNTDQTNAVSFPRFLYTVKLYDISSAFVHPFGHEALMIRSLETEIFR